MQTPALDAAAASGIPHRVVTYGTARNIEDAARQRKIEIGRIIKTLVVRRGEDDHVFVLVPGDRVIDWPLLRSHLGRPRLSLAEAAEALRVTGYPPGAITPFGSRTVLPVIAEELILSLGEVSIGGGAPGVAVHLDGKDLIAHLGADAVAVTQPR